MAISPSLVCGLLLAAAAPVSPETAVSAEAVASPIGTLGFDLTIGLLLLGGLVLVLLETVIPGGLLGIAGGAMMIMAVVMTYNHHGALAGTLVSAGALIVSITIISIAWVRLPHTRVGKSMFLDPNPGESGAPSTPEALIRSGLKPGDRGRAVTDLHPSGTVRFEGGRADVVSRGKFIAQGTPVEIMEIDGTRVVVSESADDSESAPRGED